MKGIRITSPWVLYLLSLALLPVATAVVAIANPMPEGACSGIGWGCSLYGWDAALFGLVIVGVPFIAICGMLILVSSFLPGRWKVLSKVVGWVAVAGPTYVVA